MPFVRYEGPLTAVVLPDNTVAVYSKPIEVDADVQANLIRSGEFHPCDEKGKNVKYVEPTPEPDPVPDPEPVVAPEPTTSEPDPAPVNDKE